jgi:hypothetical protein
MNHQELFVLEYFRFLSVFWLALFVLKNGITDKLSVLKSNVYLSNTEFRIRILFLVRQYFEEIQNDEREIS